MSQKKNRKQPRVPTSAPAPAAVPAAAPKSLKWLLLGGTATAVVLAGTVAALTSSANKKPATPNSTATVAAAGASTNKDAHFNHKVAAEVMMGGHAET